MCCICQLALTFYSRAKFCWIDILSGFAYLWDLKFANLATMYISVSSSNKDIGFQGCFFSHSQAVTNVELEVLVVVNRCGNRNGHSNR